MVVIVAQRAGQVAGYAYAGMEGNDYMALRGPAGVLYDLVVDPDFRREEIGSRLLDASLAALAGLGAPRVVLFSAEKNQIARAMFAARGFRNTMIEMTRAAAGRPILLRTRRSAALRRRHRCQIGHRSHSAWMLTSSSAMNSGCKRAIAPVLPGEHARRRRRKSRINHGWSNAVPDHVEPGSARCARAAADRDGDAQAKADTEQRESPAGHREPRGGERRGDSRSAKNKDDGKVPHDRRRIDLLATLDLAAVASRRQRPRRRTSARSGPRPTSRP